MGNIEVGESPLRGKIPGILRKTAAVVGSGGYVCTLVNRLRPGVRDDKAQSPGESAFQPGLKGIEVRISDGGDESSCDASPTLIGTAAVN